MGPGVCRYTYKYITLSDTRSALVAARGSAICHGQGSPVLECLNIGTRIAYDSSVFMTRQFARQLQAPGVVLPIQTSVCAETSASAGRRHRFKQRRSFHGCSASNRVLWQRRYR